MASDEASAQGELPAVKRGRRALQPSGFLPPVRPTPPAGTRPATDPNRSRVAPAMEPAPPLTPEELAAPLAAVPPDDTLPLPVRIGFEQLVFELRALDPAERAAALAYVTAELAKRSG